MNMSIRVPSRSIWPACLLCLALAFVLFFGDLNLAQAQVSKPNAMTQRLQQLADPAAQALPSAASVPAAAPPLAPPVTLPIKLPDTPSFAPSPTIAPTPVAAPALIRLVPSAPSAPTFSSEGVPQAAPAASASVVAPAAAEPDAVVTQDPEKIKAYKKLVAQHLYKTHAQQVHKGKLPPNLPAVAVVDLTIDAQGKLEQLNWRRRPANAEFGPITEKFVKAGDPFPPPTGLGRVHFLEIWLWTKEQTFQLDSLTEGQR